MKTRKYVFSIIIGLFLSVLILNLSESYAKATGVPLTETFYFEMNGQKKTEYELKTPEALLSITSKTWELGTTVDWVALDSDVVDIEIINPGSNTIKLVRKGPGYAAISATVWQGSKPLTFTCLIKVDLAFDVVKTGLTSATTTNDRILVINEIDDKKPIFLKYVDYTPKDELEEVSGAAIIIAPVTWNSDNESVAIVDDNGNVTAVGSGNATISVTTNTVSSQDKYLSISLGVVVKPRFSLTFGEVEAKSVEKPYLSTPVMGVPSNFVIESNAQDARNLKWIVYDNAGNKINATGNAKLTYDVSDLSGNVSFNNVKAGTYEIYAFAHKDYNTGTNAPYAYMKIIVPIDLSNRNIIMTVDDTYSIMDNTNIPAVNIFEYYYVVGNSNIARIDQNGNITAKRKGTVKLSLIYKTAQNLYDSSIEFDDDEFFINISVIDGISLSTTSATLYTSGTLLLQAMVTDPTQLIVWSSSDNTIATVEEGLVTAKKKGTVVITAKQTINGVVKKATCEITIQPSVSTITITPSKITLPIGGFNTLHASILPKDLSGVTLSWKSSDINVVTVEEASALTATIKGVAGGHAVISAINQDNVVVGYCHVSVQQPVTSMVLSETDITLDLSTKRVQLRATVYPNTALNKTVNWSTTDATKARVDENGLITLLKPGTVSIIATSDDNPTVRVICNLNIQIPVVSITLDETVKTMYVGQSARLSYLILPVNASTNTVTWTSTNPSVVTVDATGKVTAKNVGTSVIILKTLDGGRTIYCTITVKRVATGVKFDVSELTLKKGEYYYIKTTLTPNDSTDKELAWESSDTKVAVVNADGKIDAKSSGTAIIMARTETGGTTYCKVTVTQPVNGLLLNFTEKILFVGNKFDLKVSISPSDASEMGVTWVSSNPKVATVSKTGVVEGLIGGMTVITCTTVDGGFAAACVVTVREEMSKITLNYENYNLGIDKTVMLIATVTTETATNQNVTWVSSNKKVATVNNKGKVTGISLGYATITAIAQDGSEVEASCELRVVNPVSGITLDKNYLAMLVGESKPLKVTIRPSNATYKVAKWSSSDESIAIVDEEGTVTALKAGSATILAEAQDNSGKKVSCYITVRDRLPATGITVMDKKLIMVPGEEKIVQVALNPVASTDGFSWSTDNAAVAKIDKKTGKITAVATGTANITVMTDSGKTAMIEVTVIGLNITSLTLEQYTTYQYPLKVEGFKGVIDWSVNNPEIAVISPQGKVSSRAVGKATITATVNGRKLTCKLTVTKIR